MLKDDVSFYVISNNGVGDFTLFIHQRSKDKKLLKAFIGNACADKTKKYCDETKKSLNIKFSVDDTKNDTEFT